MNRMVSEEALSKLPDAEKEQCPPNAQPALKRGNGAEQEE